MRILVVDDQAAIRCMLKTLLEEETNYIVSTVANGYDALTYLRQTPEPPELILLDLAMPIMTGWDFLREQQTDPTLAPIPVILMTARGDCDNADQNIYSAMYVHKPTELKILLEAIRHHYEYRVVEMRPEQPEAGCCAG